LNPGKVDTLVATDLAARGVDVNGISHEINFDPPQDSETYVDRIGRACRAGRKRIGITLLTSDQRCDVTQLAGQLGLDHGLHNPGPRSPEVVSAPHLGPRNGRTPCRPPRRRRTATQA
jgi:superfamily II DNA/RNA helicase